MGESGCLALAPSSGKTEPMEERLSKAEIRKDALQETVQSVASTVGEVASIITTAVKDVAGAIGGLVTDVFEIRDGARRASEHAEEE
jgi:phytoene/squalene synthetase